MIAGDLSKPPPSASRPPHRGEIPKYTTGFDLRSTALSPELSLKLSLPAPRTGLGSTSIGSPGRASACSGFFRRLSGPQVLEAVRLPRMGWRPLLGSVARLQRREMTKDHCCARSDRVAVFETVAVDSEPDATGHFESENPLSPRRAGPASRITWLGTPRQTPQGREFSRAKAQYSPARDYVLASRCSSIPSPHARSSISRRIAEELTPRVS